MNMQNNSPNKENKHSNENQTSEPNKIKVVFTILGFILLIFAILSSISCIALGMSLNIFHIINWILAIGFLSYPVSHRQSNYRKSVMRAYSEDSSTDEQVDNEEIKTQINVDFISNKNVIDDFNTQGTLTISENIDPMNMNQNVANDFPNQPQEKKGKYTIILIVIMIILLVIAILGRYLWHQMNPEPMQIQFVDISMSIPGNLTEITGDDYQKLFNAMDSEADAKTAYIKADDSHGNIDTLFYALQYSDASNTNIDQLIRMIEDVMDIPFDVKNYSIGNIDAKIVEHSDFPAPAEDYIERTAIFIKDDNLYMISYIMNKNEDEKKFYESIDTIR